MKFKFREIAEPKEQFSTFLDFNAFGFRMNDWAVKIYFNLIILRISVGTSQLTRRT